MSINKEYVNFILTSFFYDLSSIIDFFDSEIDKLENIDELKSKLNSIFIDDEIISNVSKKLDDIISKMDGFEFIGADNKTLLKSIFTTFKKYNKKEEEKKIKVDNIKYYPLSILENQKIIYPNKKYSDKITKEVSSLIIENIDLIIKSIQYNELSKFENLNYILNILSNIFSYIPYSSKYNSAYIGDISFYDKLKINTALSSCLYLLKDRDNSYNIEDENKKHFVLLSGDISGIQKFIYTISSNGALKSLRARSFYLEIMLEHIADEILDYFNVTRANLLYTGGGHFYIILPNYEDIKNKIDDIMISLNDWFVDNFSIDLYIALGIEGFCFNDLSDFASVFKKLSAELTGVKQRRYVYDDKKDQLLKLLEAQYNKAEDECNICHTSSKKTYKKKDLSKEGKEVYVCNTCYNLYKTGKYMLYKEESIFVINDVNTLKDEEKIKVVYLPPSFANKDTNRYLYFGKKEDINSNILVRAYSKNNDDYNYTNLFLGDYNFKEDKENKDLIDFETLVNGTENNPTLGINRLAVLRCDVDSLGDGFMNGFRGHADILRTSAFSRHLSLFFKYYINFVCFGDISLDDNDKLFGDKYFNKEKRIVIVYAGGDDVFLVGHWLDVINFSLDLRKAFIEYTNDSLTFSAGIGFFHIKYPISKMASQTGELEDLAKENENGRKNSVALFGISPKDKSKYVFGWEDFERIKGKIDFLFKNCYFSKEDYNKSKVMLSTSLMYRLKQLIELSSKDKYINIARLAYSLARINHDYNNKECYNEFKDNIYNWFTSEDKKDIKYFNIALDLIIYLFRKDL